MRSNIELIHGDCMEYKYNDTFDLVLLDPPFDIWKDLKKFEFNQKTTVCFTNFQNREYVTNLYGTPRVELIWHIPEGRWVSNNFPQLNHENILIYGELGNSFIVKNKGIKNPIKKGRSCIGSDKNLGERIYTPKDMKMLNSVLKFPRNMNSGFGCFGKPKQLIDIILKWLCKENYNVFDPFLGSGTTAISCWNLKFNLIGVEINKEYYDKAVARLERHKAQGQLF